MQTMKFKRGFVREDGLVFWGYSKGIERWMSNDAYQIKKLKRAACKKADYEANREEILAKQKIYREANLEKISAAQKARYEANREKRLAAQSIYRKVNKEKLAKAAKAYRLANIEKRAAADKAYYEANRDNVLAQSKAYRDANREKIAAWSRAYYLANKDKSYAAGSRRRALKKGLTPKGVNLKLIQTFYDQAARLTRAWSAPHIDPKFRVSFEVDHIIPLIKQGLHEASNLQVIPARLNARKNDKLNYPMPSGYSNALQFSY